MEQFKEIRIFSEGRGELFQPPDLDGFRAYVRRHKVKGLVNKVVTEQEAVMKLVQDGDYLVYDCNMFQRGPSLLVREIIRQGKKNLGVAGKFTYMDIALLVAGGCVDRIDVGFIGVGLAPVTKAIRESRVRLTEWSNSAMTMRLLAGAMGMPFIPASFLGGTDVYAHSAAKTIEDPYTGRETILLPALNPDIAMIHVHQSDTYGNARVFGSDIAAWETAASSRKVIISAEEIIDTEDIRKDPGRTTIPYFLVDAVVEAPFGAYPGEMSGLYAADMDHVTLLLQAATNSDETPMLDYLERNVHSVGSNLEFLEKRVGFKRLMQLKRQAEIKEGYYP